MSKPATLPINLTSRDLAVVGMVHRYTGCTIEQLHRRFWPRDTHLTACYQRVNRLISAEVLWSYRLPSLSGTGSGKAFVLLGRRGRSLLREQGLVVSSHHGHDLITPLFARHHLAIGDVRIALEQAVEQLPRVELLDWTPESVLKRQPIHVTETITVEGEETTRTITLIPDGAFTLSAGGRTERILLEMDMGTMAPKRLRLKFHGYFLHQAGSGTRQPIFVVARTASRAAYLRRLAENEADKLQADGSVIFVTDLDQLVAGDMLTSPIWQQGGVPGLHAILPDQLPQTGPLPQAGGGGTAVWQDMGGRDGVGRLSRRSERSPREPGSENR